MWVVSRLAGDRPMSLQFRKVIRLPLLPIPTISITSASVTSVSITVTLADLVSGVTFGE